MTSLKCSILPIQDRDYRRLKRHEETCRPARAVVSNPEIVLFDEPTTGLDPIMIEFVDSLIEKGQREFGLTSVVVSHDMASNRRLADTIAVLSDGRIVENNAFDTLLTSKHPAAPHSWTAPRLSRHSD